MKIIKNPQKVNTENENKKINKKHTLRRKVRAYSIIN